MAKVIGICNSKGGVGKTTTTDAMGAGLVKLGKKVLIVDADDSNPSLSKVHGFYDEQMTITDLMLFTSCGRPCPVPGRLSALHQPPPVHSASWYWLPELYQSVCNHTVHAAYQ